MFLEQMQDYLAHEGNRQFTENGAMGYASSGSSLVDLNFQITSFRNSPPTTIVSAFTKAYYEDPVLAVKWLFFARDIRGGLGERRTFRILMAELAQSGGALCRGLVRLIPTYGRCDDLWELLDTPCQGIVLDYTAEQLAQDTQSMAQGKPISLLAKWMPSITTSSHQSVRQAKILAHALGLTAKEYRQTLSALRAYLDVVEVKMTANYWEKINYSTVPSRANLIYRNAFLAHDPDRRAAFLKQVEAGQAAIHAGVLFPHDIVTQYQSTQHYSRKLAPQDRALEALWAALPNTVTGGNTLVVADGSGSMYSRVGRTNTTALDVANALAIYFAERNHGAFSKQYMTFSNKPQLVSFQTAKTLRSKLQIALAHDEVSNTNIEAVFDLILNTAINKHLKQRDLPKTILIISDMEFDRAVEGRVDKPLFEELEHRFRRHKYRLPRLVFWNVCSRTSTIPLTKNKAGVALVSGFSVNVVNMVLSGQLNPYQTLIEQLNTPRYAPIEQALLGVSLT